MVGYKNSLYVVSACLAGIPCRYDGRANPCAAVERLYHAGRCLALCPEVLGGLMIPRLPMEIQEGRVMRSDGRDETAHLAFGVERAMRLLTHFTPAIAILKSRSPSCGYLSIYDGTFSHTLTLGSGLFARALHKKGYTIYSEENCAGVVDL